MKQAGLLALLMLTLIARVSQAQTFLPGTKLGINDDYFHGFAGGDDAASMQRAADGNLGTLRIPIWWFQLQPVQPANMNDPASVSASMDAGAWAALESKVASALTRGLTIYATLAAPPQWSTGVPASSSLCGSDNHPCNNNDVPFYCVFHAAAAECQGSHPIPEAAVRQFVKYAVTRLKGKVKYWSWIEEPHGFWTGDAQPLSNGNRTTPDFITYVLRPAYEEAKRADPGVTVVGPGEDVTPNQCYLLQYANAYFDIVAFHMYRTTLSTFQTGLNDMKACFDAYGQGKQIWISEFGANTSDPTDGAAQNAQAATLQDYFNEIHYNRPWIRKALLYRLRGTAANDYSITVDSTWPKVPWYTASNLAASTARPKASIDMSLPSSYITDATGGPGYDDFVLVSNPNASPIWARLTFVRSDGTGQVRDVNIAANSRYTAPLNVEPGVAGEGPVSVAVQSLSGLPVYADHSTYWGPGYSGGRSTEGIATPSPQWFFAEGNVAPNNVFQEWLTVFNPNAQPVNVQFDFLRTSGGVISKIVRIYEGPGRVRIRVNDLIPDGVGEHSTAITARYDNGALAPVTAERTMEWFEDSRDGHSTPGVPAPQNNWYFAEGYNGGQFNTFICVSNPNVVPANVTVTFYGESGATASSSAVVSPQSRFTFTAPGSLPPGGFGFTVSSDTPVVAERPMYWTTGGVTWAGGSAGVGSPALAYHWLAAEGSASSFFHTYILILNPYGSAATATVRFLRADGVVITRVETINPHSRGVVDANAWVAGDFSTDVQTDLPVVVERQMYWTYSDWYGGHVTLARIVP